MHEEVPLSQPEGTMPDCLQADRQSDVESMAAIRTITGKILSERKQTAQDFGYEDPLSLEESMASSVGPRLLQANPDATVREQWIQKEVGERLEQMTRKIGAIALAITIEQHDGRLHSASISKAGGVEINGGAPADVVRFVVKSLRSQFIDGPLVTQAGINARELILAVQGALRTRRIDA